jgi:hypothetical protein
MSSAIDTLDRRASSVKKSYCVELSKICSRRAMT